MRKSKVVRITIRIPVDVVRAALAFRERLGSDSFGAAVVGLARAGRDAVFPSGIPAQRKK